MKVRSPIFLALTYILYLRDGPVIFEDGGKERGGGVRMEEWVWANTKTKVRTKLLVKKTFGLAKSPKSTPPPHHHHFKNKMVRS